MPEIAVKDINNKDAGKLSLPDDVFAVDGKDALIHSAVVNHLANRRQGTHATKTRGKVRGGGAKPYRQKGTGRARAGTNNSPIWRGGGTVFGPEPRDYSYKMPRKARRKAFFAAVSGKITDDEVVVVDSLSMDEPKTGKMAGILKGLGLSEGSLLVVTKVLEPNVALSLRNLPGVNLRQASDVNAYDMLSHDKVLITKEAMESLQDRAVK
jgi:large subunit ribosomal protein L4